MKKYLVYVLKWLLRKLEPVVEDLLVKRARELVLKAEGFAEGTSGQYKRDYVFSRLVKEFPELRKRDISFTIEKVIQDGIV